MTFRIKRKYAPLALGAVLWVLTVLVGLVPEQPMPFSGMLVCMFIPFLLGALACTVVGVVWNWDQWIEAYREWVDNDPFEQE